MKDILVVGKLKEGAFEKFMGFMQSDEGMAERKKVADVSKTIASVSPDKSTIMFKIAVHDMAALHSFLDGSNPVSKPVFDEVMAGLNPAEIDDIVKVIKGIRDRGVTIFLIENFMKAVMNLSDRTFVLNDGKLIASGTPSSVAENPQVIEAYLGHGAAEAMAEGAWA